MKQQKSKVSIVYEHLLKEMINRNYKSGDRIVISKVAKTCNVSDIPVREALRRLESDGYIKINANQGAVAIGIDKSSLIDIFQVKGILEGYATRLSIDYLSPNDIRELRSLNEKLRIAAENGDYDLYSHLNMEFHLQLYSKTPRRELINLIMDLWKKWSITKSVFSIAPSRMELSYQEHENIIRLIEAREYEKVELYVREHKFHAAEKMINQSSTENII